MFRVLTWKTEWRTIQIRIRVSLYIATPVTEQEWQQMHFNRWDITTRDTFRLRMRH